MIARAVMREKYIEADMGISGANFAVAETGMISITENEGNARLTCALPKIHVAVMGIEKVLPKLEDLALFLPMLATMGTGQALTCYNSFYSGPRLPGEIDGPEQFHLVLLDNRRTELLADPEQRDALHCIRCGACLNVCPIFKNVGGHSYGTTYQGPIGSIITPHLRGLQDFKHLSSASSLCGACTETCPVGIDIHHHLLHNRRNAAQEKPSGLEKILYAGARRSHAPAAPLSASPENSARSSSRCTSSSTARRSIRCRTGPAPAPSPRPRRKASAIIGAKSASGEKTMPVLINAAPSSRASARRCTDPRRIASPAMSITTSTHNADAHAPQAADSFRQWLPPVGPSLEEQIALFAQNSTTLKTDFRVVASADEAAQQLATLAAENKWKRIATHRHPLAQGLAEKLGLPCVFTDPSYAVTELEKCDAAITGCDSLVAQTGSILVSTQSAGGRALSVLPPHHIVIAQRSQMLPDLATALQLARQRYAPELAQLPQLHHRPQPHRRHRAHPRPRRARPEEADGFFGAVVSVPQTFNF